MKIVLVGAGSYVFAPTALDDLICRQDAPVELVLVDLNSEMAARMQRVAQRLAAGRSDITVDIKTDWCDALEGADAVLMSAAIQGKRRWQMDYDILSAQGLADQARECGGLGGLSYTLRTVGLTMDLCADMRRLCPNAYLLDAANPLPRVVIAAQRYGGIRTLGFCSAASGRYGDYERVAQLLGRAPQEIKVVAPGLNHFTFVSSITDAATGEDLLPEAKARVAAGAWGEGAAWMLEEYDAIQALPMDHAGDFVAHVPGHVRHAVAPFHGDEEERALRLRQLDTVAEGGEGWEEVVYHSSWEHPGLAAAALLGDGKISFGALNMLNDGYLEGVSPTCCVEVPATLEKGVITVPKGITMPPKALAITQRAAAVHELAAQAAATGDRDALRRAIEIDPALEQCDLAHAWRTMELLLKEHADVLKRFA